MKIFISHAWEDNSIAAKLESKLKSIGFEIWVDYSDARAGVTITSQINKALEFCDTLVLLWSKSASKSKWVEQELAPRKIQNTVSSDWLYRAKLGKPD